MDEPPAPVVRANILRKVLTLVMEDGFERAAEQFEIWRICHKLPCQRARTCRGDARRCCKMFVDWSEALALKESQADLSAVRRALMERLGEQPA